MRKLNIKNIVVVTALTLSITLTGCNNREQKNTQNQYQSPTSSSYEEFQKVEESTNIEEETTIVTEPPISEDNQETKQQEILEYFESAKKEISDYIDSEEFEQLKTKGKYYVTTGIDFIFFDEPIKGLYFDDLTEDLKQDIIRDVKALDESIMAYYPDYKEGFQTKYQVASEFISEKYLGTLDAIKEYLGEENYNAIGEIKDQVKEDISNGTDKALTYIKDKYQEWKNK